MVGNCEHIIEFCSYVLYLLTLGTGLETGKHYYRYRYRIISNTEKSITWQTNKFES